MVDDDWDPDDVIITSDDCFKHLEVDDDKTCVVICVEPKTGTVWVPNQGTMTMVHNITCNDPQ